MADTIKVKLTIEPSWTIDQYEDVIEIDAAELEGLRGSARRARILDILQDVVNSTCPWGFEEVS